MALTHTQSDSHTIGCIVQRPCSALISLSVSDLSGRPCDTGSILNLEDTVHGRGHEYPATNRGPPKWLDSGIILFDLRQCVVSNEDTSLTVSTITGDVGGLEQVYTQPFTKQSGSLHRKNLGALTGVTRGIVEHRSLLRDDIITDVLGLVGVQNTH